MVFSLGDAHHSLVQSADLVSVPLGEPPRIAYVGVGRHSSNQAGRYMLAEHWCLHIYDWKGSLEVDERRYSIVPGSVSLLPPRARLNYHYARKSVHSFTHFLLPEGELVREVKQMHYGLNSLPLIRDLLSEVILSHASEPRKSEAILWQILWRLAEERPAPVARDDRVNRACEILEGCLQDPLSIGELAYAVGLSHNQLTRLFQRNLGASPQQFLRYRRVRKSCHFLRYSDMPVREIGALVGIDDPHVFNKTFRKEMGMPPSAFRKRHRALG